MFIFIVGLIMIETFADTEIPIPWGNVGVKTWSHAHLTMHIPWIFVEYHLGNGDEQVSGMYILFNAEQLMQLADDPKMKIVNAYLVTPSYINKSMHWQMDLLKSASIGYEKGEDQRITRFELIDASEYFYPNVKLKGNFIKEQDVYISVSG